MTERNLETDLNIDVANLQEEFRIFPSMLYHYNEKKAEAEREYEGTKAQFEEAKSAIYIAIKNEAEKITEAHLKARVDTNEVVVKLKKVMLDSLRDLNTLKNYVESLRAKKDMLIQLGADARKE